MARLGALVVGQAPRPDVEHEIRSAAGTNIEIDLRGALDGLGRDEIDRLVPQRDADTLFTRLPDGDGVTISKAAVMRHGEAILAQMSNDGHGAVIVLCTGEFPDWIGKYRVIFPSRVMDAFVAAAFTGGRLGVFTPLPEQAPLTRRRWQSAGYDTAVVALSPNADRGAVAAAAAEMAGQDPSLLVFDCISYTSEAKRIAGTALGIPAILGVTATARLASELLA